MSVLTISDAAHKYGLDNFWSGVDAEFTAIIGTTTAAPVVTATSLSYHSSKGFTQTYAFTPTGSTAGILTGLTIYSPAGEALQSWTGALAGADTIQGNAFDNILQGGTGDDQIDGGAGTDTAVFSGRKAQYSIARSGVTLQVSGPDGNDTLTNIERLRFDDGSVAFDTAGTAGSAYRLYQAAFNRTPDKAGLGFQINSLDSGAALQQVAQSFIDSAEFSKTYGSLNTTQFVTQLYANVLHRAPDAAGLAFHVGTIDGGGATARAATLVSFSESAENQAALIGTIQNGMDYL